MPQRPYRIRLLLVLIAFCAALAGLIGRLYALQVLRHREFVYKADLFRKKNIPIMPKRGSIFDRNGNELAVSSLRASLYANTSMIGARQRADLARDLARIIKSAAPGAQPAPPDEPSRDEFASGTLEQRIYKKLSMPKAHVPIAQTVEPALAEQLDEFTKSDAAPENAFYFVRESKREHPRGRLASHVLGYVGLSTGGENKGRAGLELQYDKEIRGNFQKYEALRDALNQPLEPVAEWYYSEAFGNELILTLDASIQLCAEKALRECVDRYNARFGAIVVQKTKTGEILAMCSWPDYEPDRVGQSSAFERQDRLVSIPFGMGSVMKIFTASALLETRTLGLDDPVDCHGGRWTFPPRTTPVKDARGHYLYVEPFRKVFRWSSNVGMCEAASRMDKFAFGRILDNLGFGYRTGIDLPDESRGICKPASQWTGYSMSAIPYGGEMAITPVQLATALSAVANGGMLMRPHLVKEIRAYNNERVRLIAPESVRRVVSPETSRLVMELMEDVVCSGTGKLARIKDYRVGGKTGTFKYITDPGDRTASYTATFAGILPLPDPELTILCCIDEPTSGGVYGGEVAAPAFKKVAESALQILGIPPSRTDRNPADIEMTLRRVRARDQAPRATAPRGLMPDLTGLTMREVHEALAGLNVHPVFEGSGVVSAQTPLPMAPLRGVRECRVVFGQ
jgi:cell division protein FtsI (penicillin-binding protein 3)